MGFTHLVLTYVAIGSNPAEGNKCNVVTQSDLSKYGLNC